MRVTVKCEADATHVVNVSSAASGIVEVPPGKSRTIEVGSGASISQGRKFPGWIVWNAEFEQAQADAAAAQATTGQSNTTLSMGA